MAIVINFNVVQRRNMALSFCIVQQRHDFSFLCNIEVSYIKKFIPIVIIAILMAEQAAKLVLILKWNQIYFLQSILNSHSMLFS